MAHHVTDQRVKALNKNRKRRLWTRVVSALGCVVVFCTVYALILPAITASQETFCGQKEHSHSDACYERVLTCALDEGEGTVTPGHTHNSACYQEERTLTCGLQESADALDENGEVVQAGHAHGDACYQANQVLTCGLEETAAVTTEGHVHSDACYERQVTCGKKEHKHQEKCFIDKTADVETAQDWEATLPSAQELTGVWADDVLTVAESQLGYQESQKNYVIDEDKGYNRGYTRYGEWYGDPYGDWCAMFASFSLHYAGVGKEFMPRNANCQDWIDTLKKDEWGLWRPTDENGQAWTPAWVVEKQQEEALTVADQAVAAGEGVDASVAEAAQAALVADEESEAVVYNPQPGDLVFFNWDAGEANSNKVSDHVGIVVEVLPATETQPERLKTIEGNAGNCVAYVTYEMTDKSIMGYAQLPEKPEPAENAEAQDGEGEESVLSPDQQKRVDAVIEMIDALPTSEEAEEQLLAYEDAEDWTSYELYFTGVGQKCWEAHYAYQDLGKELQPYVTNYDKLVDLEWLWTAQTYTTSDVLTVYQVNKYTGSGSAETATILVHGGTVGQILGSSQPTVYWTAIVVEEDGNGGLYVGQIISTTGDKLNVTAKTTKGFVLLLHADKALASVGDSVSVNFDYLNTVGTYKSAGYGSVSFGEKAATPKDPKDNSSKLTIVPSADTSGLIEVNLWDYGDNINEKYLTNNEYPGFQQQFGTQSIGSSLTTGSFDFGNSITADLNAGINGVANKGGAINALKNGADSPISGAMSSSLQNGYPALAADKLTLDYLFSPNTYAKKMNTNSINGLFQYNETTGAYTFNSRENHAQFNPDSDTFTLYDQVISSNYMMYPFGNFLPFNDIVHDSAQSSTMDQDYIMQIARSAQYKQNNGMSETSWNEYGTLASMLDVFNERMVETYGEDWDAYDAVNAYFDAAKIPMEFTPTFPEMAPGKYVMSNVYTIDYDEETNFYFGMDMKMTFMQPKDGLTGKTGKEPMVFYFTGDDDVWVYIDDTLFLDLSGIHRHVGGEVDFQKGEVRYYSLSKATGDVSTDPDKVVKFADIIGEENVNGQGTFENYSTHTFNFYYMERGAGSGVCRMNFNFPLLRQNSISVSKEVSTDQEDVDLLGNPNYRFQVLQVKGDGTKTNDSFIAPHTAYTIYDANDNVVGSGATDDNGVFTIKAGQRAEFTDIPENAGKYYVRELLTGNEHGQYGQISVSGQLIQTDYDVVVGQDTFKGVDSPVKDMSDGATVFRFNNQVTFTKLGALEISKQLTGYGLGQAASTEDFEFQVTLDGAPLPVGTTYTVTSEDGSATESRTVQADGVVKVPADFTARVENIIAGTQFAVSETAASSKGYTVSYGGSEGVSVSGSSAWGTIQAEKSVEVSVLNSENGAAVAIPLEKTVVNPDGKEHAFTFNLVQVTDATGASVKEGGLTQEAQLLVPAEGSISDSDAFVITYLERPEATLPVTYYYRISEQVDPENQGSIDFDQAFYVVEVTLSKDGAAFNAQVTNVWKNGQGEALPLPAVASFSNTLLRDLTIQKQVQAPAEVDVSDFDFNFAVTLAKGQADLAGSYQATKKAADGTESATTVEFANGKASVSLKAGESLVIHGIPYGTQWSVAEEQANGFHASHQLMTLEGAAEVVESVTTGTHVLTDEASGVVFTNIGGYELPKSGGLGTGLHVFCGVLALVGAAVLFVSMRSRGRGVRGAF